MTHSTDELPDHALLASHCSSLIAITTCDTRRWPFRLFRTDGSCGNTIQRRLCYRVVKDAYVNSTAHEADGQRMSDPTCVLQCNMQ